MSNATPPNAPGKLKRIPTSFAVLWTYIRRQVIPVIVFAGVALAVITQWHTLGGGGVQGVAEGVRSIVAAPLPGVLMEVHVRPYEWVEAGQPLIVLQPADVRMKVDLARSELDATRLLMQPSMAENNALDYERLRVDEWKLREELVLAHVQSQLAESALRRNTLLRQDKLVTEDVYETSLRDRDLYNAQISQKSNALAQVESRLAALSPLGEPETPGTNRALQASVDRIRQMLHEAENASKKMILTAPISGMVHMVLRQPGEFVAEGEPLITINAAKSDRIVAYLRQPYPIEAELGMSVEVVTRSRNRQRFVSEITHIGAQVEVITNSLAYLRPGALVDAGLPIVIGVPQDVSIRPGESVDLIFLSGGAASRNTKTHAKQTL